MEFISSSQDLTMCTQVDALFFAHNLPMGGHVLQKRAPQLLIADRRGLLLQQLIGGVQNVPCAGILVGLQDLVTGQVDAEGFLCALQDAFTQLVQDFIHLRLCTVQVTLGQKNPGQAGLGLDDRIGLLELLAQVLHRPHFFKTPAWLLKLGLGESATLLLDSQRALPTRLQEQGFHFCYPKLQHALEEMLGARS